MAAGDQTKYRSRTISISISSTSTATTDYYDENCNPVTCSNTHDFNASRANKMTVGRYDGVTVQSDCTETRSDVVTPDPPESCPSSPQTAWEDYQCSTSGGTIQVPWVDLFASLNACDGLIYMQAPTCSNPPMSSASGDNVGTTAEWETWFEGLVPPNGADGCTSSVAATVTLSATVISMSAVGSFECITTSEETCGDVTTTITGEWTIAVTITLGDSYTAAQCVQDAYDLLSEWDLTDNTHFDFSNGCTYPFIRYDEADSPIEPAYAAAGNCTWTDPFASAPYGYAGAGYTGAMLGAPAGGTEQDEAAPQAGAYLRYEVGGQVTAIKYAEIQEERPAHNWYRPCGPDRALLGADTNPLYPSAWPICGHLDVVAATNASPIEITIDTATAINGVHYLEDGDLVDITGCVGNTAANGTDWVITRVDDTKFTLDGSTGNGAWTSGGTITNAASTSPPSETWNDSTPTGDYVLKIWKHDWREVTIDPTVRYDQQDCYSVASTICDIAVTDENIVRTSDPSIMCISPNGEAFASGNTHAMPAASAFPLDERYGAEWIAQVFQRMADPIDPATNHADWCAACAASACYVEARNSVPTGAPALPTITPPACGYELTPVCPFVECLTIAEIAALGPRVAGVCAEPGGLICPPDYFCFDVNFDVIC